MLEDTGEPEPGERGICGFGRVFFPEAFSVSETPLAVEDDGEVVAGLPASEREVDAVEKFVGVGGVLQERGEMLFGGEKVVGLEGKPAGVAEKGRVVRDLVESLFNFRAGILSVAARHVDLDRNALNSPSEGFAGLGFPERGEEERTRFVGMVTGLNLAELVENPGIVGVFVVLKA